MSDKELARIKENVYMRCEVSFHNGMGLGNLEREELALVKEIDRLREKMQKAIEYIETSTIVESSTIHFRNTLLNILGSDKE